MPRSRSGFPGRHSPSQKRLTTWDFGPETTQDTLSTPSSVVWSAGVVLLTEARATIVRTRGSALITLSTLGGVGDGFRGAMGIGIISTDAFAAGATPDPLADQDWPGWLWFQHFNVIEGAPVSADGSGFQRFEIDSKAMRKMGASETLFGCTEVTELGAGSIMQISADCRMLFKLT